MSLKLQSKNILFKLLEVLPAKTGFSVYHNLQRLLSGDKILQKIESTHASFLHFVQIAEQLKISIVDKQVMEIGSGWLPLMPYHFLFQGAVKAVSTYDIAKHYRKSAIHKLNGIYMKKFRLEFEVKSPFLLPRAVKYFPNTDLRFEENLEANIVFSRFVLEHVDPKHIRAMHQRFKNELKEGSYIFHFISPSDHRAYVDKNLSLQDFLQFSEQEWRRRCTSYDYHNRLRLPQYVNLFEELGFEIVYLNYDFAKPGSSAFQRFKNVNLHQDFREFSNEELTAGSINLVLKV